MVRRSLTYLISKRLHQPSSTADLLAFLVILYLARRSTSRKGLLGTIVRDATKYFIVIFTGHLTLTMTVLFAKVNSRIFLNYDDAKSFFSPPSDYSRACKSELSPPSCSQTEPYVER